MSYPYRFWSSAGISIVSLLLGILTFVSVQYFSEAQGVAVFIFGGLTTIIIATIGFLFGVESYRKTRDTQSLIGLLVGFGVLAVIVTILLSPWVTA